MSEKKVPFSEEKAKEIIAKFESPIYIYDELGIRNTARELNAAFSWAKGYKNYFAVKATPTPGIMKVLYEEGMGFDCSTRAELEIVRKMGVVGNDIFYSSNNTPKEDFELAIEMGATVNIDDLTQVSVFVKALSDRKETRVSLRYNPGNAQSGNKLIGEPIEAKYGMSLDQMIKAYKMLKNAGLKTFGLHTMVVSNELNADYFGLTIKLLKEAADKIQKEANVKIRFINLGGGFGVNYSPEDEPIDIIEISKKAEAAFRDMDIELYTENGRYVTGPHGYLLTTVRYVMEKYKKYVGLDASMHNLMRPAMYGAYHHISIFGKEELEPEEVYDVVGSLCENNDKFAIDRRLPMISSGDLLVIHDAGAHGHAMGFNYNGQLRSGEVLLHPDGKFYLIRRAETLDDYFGTIVW